MDVAEEELEEKLEEDEEELNEQSAFVPHTGVPAVATRTHERDLHSVCSPHGMLALHSLAPAPLTVLQVFAKHSVCSCVPQSRYVLHSSVPMPATVSHVPPEAQTVCVKLAELKELEEDPYVQVRKQLQPFSGVGSVMWQMPPLMQVLGKHLPQVTCGQTEEALLEDEEEDEELDEQEEDEDEENAEELLTGLHS